MKVNFNKETKFNNRITEAFNNAERLLKFPFKVGCDISYVSRLKIKKINKKFRNKNKVTDVLSFPNALKPEVENMQVLDWQNARLTAFDPVNNYIFLGDIMISLGVAKKQAKEYGHSLEREVSYLAVHGLLHLLGYDHMIDSEKQIMRELEEKILN